MTNQKNKSKKLHCAWLSPAGAVIILICFFYPWLKVGFVVGKKIETGFTLANKASPIWLIPIMALLVILLYIRYLRGLSSKWYRVGTFFTASFGLVMIVMTYLTIEEKLSGFFVKRITSHQLELGMIGTFIGFLLIFFTLFLPKKKN